MARVPARMSRVRKLPWLLILRSAQLIWTHLRDDLTPQERRQLGRLVRTPPHRLTSAEWADMRAIVRRVDLGSLGKDLALLRGLRK